MAALAGVKPAAGQGVREGRLSRPVFLLTLAAVTSSSLSFLSLYQLVSLRAEVEGLKSDFSRRREGQEVRPRGQTENIHGSGGILEPLHQPESQHSVTHIRKKRTVQEPDMLVSSSCLQMLANTSRKTFRRELPTGPHTGIPWQPGLSRGAALVPEGDRIVVREEGFYFVYSQVYYMDTTFTMGHVVIRWKKNLVGNEEPDVHLFRCIQNMQQNKDYSFNTCYTGGIVKLEPGDHLELLIPRATANISLEGDSTFLGAIKLI